MGGHWKKEQEKAESQAPQICRYARARARTRAAAAALPEEHGDEAEEARAEGEAEPEKARVEREADPPAPLPKILPPRAVLPPCFAPIRHTRAAPLLPFTTNARRHRSTVASASPSAPLAPLLPPTRLLPLPLLLTRKERMGKENARTSASQS